MTDHNLCERKWQLLQCHCNYTACIAKNDRWISDSISDADKKRVLHFCIQNQPESFIPVTILLSYEQCYVQHLLSTIHSNKLSVESKTGERRMDKCWNSIGMGFKCWRQREWRMKFYHLHLYVQCFWLFVLFDWHIPNYDDSDNNSSICANAVLPTTKCTWCELSRLNIFLEYFCRFRVLSFWFFGCRNVCNELNKQNLPDNLEYRPYCQHFSKVDQMTVSDSFALIEDFVMWVPTQIHNGPSEKWMQRNQLNRKSNKLIIKKYIAVVIHNKNKNK